MPEKKFLPQVAAYINVLINTAANKTPHYILLDLISVYLMICLISVLCVLILLMITQRNKQFHVAAG